MYGEMGVGMLSGPVATVVTVYIPAFGG